jgi:hypothetical protein
MVSRGVASLLRGTDTASKFTLYPSKNWTVSIRDLGIQNMIWLSPEVCVMLPSNMNAAFCVKQPGDVSQFLLCHFHSVTTRTTELLALPATNLSNFRPADAVHCRPRMSKVPHGALQSGCVGPNFFRVAQGFRVTSSAMIVCSGDVFHSTTHLRPKNKQALKTISGPQGSSSASRF